MSTCTLGYDKKYKCPYCKKFFDDRTILEKNSWKCPKCNHYIQIAAPSLNSGYTLIRKPVKELKEGDSVHVYGSREFYDVITVTKNKKGYKVALKNYGQMPYNASDFVNVVIGGYYENSWEDICPSDRE